MIYEKNLKMGEGMYSSRVSVIVSSMLSEVKFSLKEPPDTGEKC